MSSLLFGHDRFAMLRGIRIEMVTHVALSRNVRAEAVWRLSKFPIHWAFCEVLLLSFLSLLSVSVFLSLSLSGCAHGVEVLCIGRRVEAGLCSIHAA